MGGDHGRGHLAAARRDAAGRPLALRTGKEAPKAGWGWIAVPGNWRDQRSLLAPAGEPAMPAFDRDAVRSAWYEREIAIPAAWKGRAVLLDLERVSTDATVFLDGKPCGAVN